MEVTNIITVRGITVSGPDNSPSMSIATLDLLAIIVIVVFFLFVCGMLIRKIIAFRTEAVKRGFAYWAISNDGSVTFTWNPPVTKPLKEV